jgi:hypothetical protein
MDENGTGTTMLVQPAGFGGNGGGNGFMDGSGGWWILLLFILLGGWGNNNGVGGGFGGGMGGLYPWMNQSNQISEGFQNQMLNDNITGIQNSLNGISTQLCNNQMADLERSFAAQTANTAGLTALQAQFAQCCCDNRLATCQTQNIVQSEGAATRNVVQSEGAATRNTIQGSVQTILDKLCALELDGYKRENDNLRSQLNMAELKASQTAQNAFIAQGLTNEVDQLYNRLSNCPVPSVPVYGRQPIFNCNQGNGCGCGA